MGKFCPMCRHVGGASYSVDILKIHDSFKNGQMIGRQVNVIAAMHYREAQEKAPYRTGRLKREHYVDIHPVTAGPQRAYTVGTHVDYAIFLFGTAGGRSGRITGKGDGKYNGLLLLRPIPYSWFKADSVGRFQKSVSGQNKHPDRNWLKRALLVVLAKKGVLTIDAAVAMSRDLETKS
jgi:hypothetical protein